MPEPTHPDDYHGEAEEMLPWYATGQLDVADRTLVEGHLASCVKCQRQLSAERLVIEKYRAMDSQADSGWDRLRAQIAPRAPLPARIGGALNELLNVLRRPALATFAVAQLAFVIVAGALLISMTRPSYQALGSSEEPHTANVLIMFTPSSTERDMRDTLRGSDASLVGGPTSTGAYLLHVGGEQRGAALAKLRAARNVQLAEPIDGAAG